MMFHGPQTFARYTVDPLDENGTLITYLQLCLLVYLLFFFFSNWSLLSAFTIAFCNFFEMNIILFGSLNLKSMAPAGFGLYDLDQYSVIIIIVTVTVSSFLSS